MPPFNATPGKRKPGTKLSKDVIDASPGTGDQPVNNLIESKAWKGGSRGLKRFWFNYKKLLSDSFHRMSRIEQEELIEKFSVILTVGSAILLCLAFSAVTPAPVRLLGIPVALVAAWWAGSNIVAGVVIDRMEGILKKDG